MGRTYVEINLIQGTNQHISCNVVSYNINIICNRLKSSVSWYDAICYLYLLAIAMV